SMSAPHVAGLVALYIAANGRATNAAGVYAIRQAIINNSLPQSQWRTNQTGEKGNPAPLAMPSENWVPVPKIAGPAAATNGYDFSFQTVPGYDYALEYKRLLNGSNDWNAVSTFSATGSLTTATVRDTAQDSSRFYRVKRSASIAS